MNREEMKNLLRTGKVAPWDLPYGEADETLRREMEIYNAEITAEIAARTFVNEWLKTMSPLTHWTDNIEDLIRRIATALKNQGIRS